jgi:general secretion pathway protein K
VRRASRRDGERGVALVVVLWFTAAIAALAVAFGALARGEALRSRNMVDAITARALLRAALDRGVMEILEPTVPAPAPGVALDWQLAGARLVITIRGESGKVDLNGADSRVLRGLVEALGRDEAEAANVADAIVDWRDEDSLRQPHGAEDRDYRAADHPGAAADAPFVHAGELREVLPVDMALYRGLRPLVTVSTGRPRPDLDRAPEVVRNAVLGIAEAQQDEPEADDEEELGGPPRRDEADLGEGPEPASADAGDTAGQRVIEGVTDPAQVFSLRLDVRLADGYEAHADAVVWLSEGADGRPYRILDWDPSPLRGAEGG